MGVVNAFRAWTLGVAIGEVDVREDVEEEESRRPLDFSFERVDEGEKITGTRCGRVFRMMQ